MAFGNRRDYEDYTMDDELDEAEDLTEDAYDEDNNEKFTLSQYIKKFFDWRRVVGNDRDSDYEEEEEEENARSKRQKRSKRKENAYEERETDNGEDFGEEDFSEEDLNRYDRKYGTKGSSRRAYFRKKTQERINPDGGSSSRKQRASSTSSSRWEGYRGTVKNIWEAAPMTMEDIEEIADKLMDDNAAIINLRGMRLQKEKAISFLDGVSFAIEYRFELIGDDFYICAPAGFMVPFKFGNTARSNRR